MSAQTAPASDALAGVADPVESARERICAAALRPGTTRQVGLELECHLVDLAQPLRRPDWAPVQALVTGLPPMPAGSTVTLEPGGQVELSTPPMPDVVAAVAALRADRAALAAGLVAAGFGAAALGTDPAREPGRINPHPRYAAMERHFEAVGCPGPGRTMMTATAALQVNLDAGPAEGWSRRLDLLHSLVPVLVALSATSAYLAGRATGWHSARQQVWSGIDRGRAGALPPGPPAERWADYALAAPVMMVRDGGRLVAVTSRLSFAEWLRHPASLGRPATAADLDHHLTTLFPPVRPRGYVEIRCLDALPDRWWPALAALTATLADDPVAADRVAELCEPLSRDPEVAARRGMADPAVRAAARGCARLAAERAPAGLAADVATVAELAEDGRCVGDELRARAGAHGPLRLLEEEARA